MQNEYTELSNEEKLTMSKNILTEKVRMGSCDLHIHTSFSDGADSAASIVQKVIENKLKCFSVTDHDSVEGVKEVIRVLEKICSMGMKCPEFIPGVELSVKEENIEVHILGYFPLGGFEKISEFIKIQQKSRHSRNVKMCNLLTEKGMPVSIEELKSQGTTVVGRLHAANILMKKGYVKSVKEAFDNWLARGRPCYATREKPSAKEAIEAIRNAGGIAVVAHPFLYGWTGGKKVVSDVLIEKLETLKTCGLSGVEVFHGEADSMQVLETKGAADTLDLIATAGSDYHGNNKHELKMFSEINRFYRENEEVIIGGILEIKDKILMVKNSTGIQEENWCLPKFISSGKTYDKKNHLKSNIEKTTGAKIIVEKHYATSLHEKNNHRQVYITYRCRLQDENKNIIDKLMNSSGMRLMSLNDNELFNLETSDGIIIDKLREISFI